MRRRAALLLLLAAPGALVHGLMLEVHEASAGHAAWIETVELPTPLRAANIIWDADRAYIIGGTGSVINAGSAAIYVYEPTLDRITVSDTTLPYGLAGAAMAWDDVERVAYLFGGCKEQASATGCVSTAILRYDFDAGIIEDTGHALPRGSFRGAAFWDGRHLPEIGCGGGCAYLLGGSTSATGSGATNEIIQYNPRTGSVVERAETIINFVSNLAVIWDGARHRAFASGGLHTSGTPSAQLQTYDPVADLVVNLGAMPFPVHSHSMIVIGAKMYLLPGTLGSTGPGVMIFDPATAGWEERPIPALAGVREAVALWDGTNTYVVGGFRVSASNTVPTIIRYPPFGHPPIANIAPIAPVECEDARGDVTLDAIGTFDPDGDAVTLEWWSPDDATFEDTLAVRTTASVPLGNSVIRLTASDGLLEDTAVSSARVVDTIPPRTTAELDGVPGNDDWWRSGVDVTLTATDRCQLGETFSSIDEATPVAGLVATVAGDGAHDVGYWSVDASGLAEQPRHVSFKIDATPPDVYIDRPVPFRTYLNDAEVTEAPDAPYTVAVGALTIEVSADDVTSLMSHVDFSVDGHLRATDAEAPYEFVWASGDEAAGTHLVTARAFDNAGNDATSEVEVTTVPTTQQGVVATAGFQAACELVLGPAQCRALQDTIEQLDPAPTVNLMRDIINEFLRECEETLSRTVCALLPDELPGDQTSSRDENNSHATEEARR